MRYEVLPLAEIAIGRLTLVKQTVRWYGDQDHSRWVFRTSRGYTLAGSRDLYVKIWNPTYVRRDNVVHGIEAGFYDDDVTPALRAVIFHRGLCRGYVMHRANRVRHSDPGFSETVRAKTVASGFCQLHFSPDHTLRYRDTWTLIDLEAIYPISELPDIHVDHATFDCPEYERFVADVFRETFPRGRTYVCAARRDARLPRSSVGRRAAQVAWRKSHALYRLARTWIDTRLMNQTHLIAY